jgi:hypothetical protein
MERRSVIDRMLAVAGWTPKTLEPQIETLLRLKAERLPVRKGKRRMDPDIIGRVAELGVLKTAEAAAALKAAPLDEVRATLAPAAAALEQEWAQAERKLGEWTPGLIVHGPGCAAAIGSAAGTMAATARAKTSSAGRSTRSCRYRPLWPTLQR